MLAKSRRVSSLPFFVVLEVCTTLARLDLGIVWGEGKGEDEVGEKVGGFNYNLFEYDGTNSIGSSRFRLCMQEDTGPMFFRQ